ncbi:hypothetical protein NQZ68_017448 [Dissostichus eleginoides]|nr:hypothetical protein NQZ68_017448 [Dissostichus eleginoides]
MAGASSYWSPGADLCQGLTHSSLLCPPTSCYLGAAQTLPWSYLDIKYKSKLQGTDGGSQKAPISIKYLHN